MIYVYNPTHSGGYSIYSGSSGHPSAAVRYVPPTPRLSQASPIRGSATGHVEYIPTMSPVPTVRPDPTRGVPPTPANPTATPHPPDAATWICQPQYGWPCEVALGVAWCESRYDPTALSYYYGLFQIDYDLHYELFHGGDPLDPWVNTQAAYELWLEQGWTPWPNC